MKATRTLLNRVKIPIASFLTFGGGAGAFILLDPGTNIVEKAVAGAGSIALTAGATFADRQHRAKAARTEAMALSRGVDVVIPEPYDTDDFDTGF